MAEREMFLITSGEYSDYRVEFAVVTEALAKAGVDKVRETRGDDAGYRPMPVLDYIPERVKIWSRNIILDRHLGWRFADAGLMAETVWDFESPKLGVAVEIESDPASPYSVQIIRVAHADKALVRSVTETMLAELRKEGPARPVTEAPGHEG